MTAEQSTDQVTGPPDDLRRLGRLIGTWHVTDPSGSDAVEGQVSYEWLDGQAFLMQRVDLLHGGQQARGIEVIGHTWPLGGEADPDITSRYYDHDGHTLDYVYELDGDTLTIWGGEKESAAYFRGTFDASGDRLTGSWVWPGGGYDSSMTRIRS
jgi:hypothetical protein